jgi:hypothetical protein
MTGTLNKSLASLLLVAVAALIAAPASDAFIISEIKGALTLVKDVVKGVTGDAKAITDTVKEAVGIESNPQKRAIKRQSKGRRKALQRQSRSARSVGSQQHSSRAAERQVRQTQRESKRQVRKAERSYRRQHAKTRNSSLKREDWRLKRAQRAYNR